MNAYCIMCARTNNLAIKLDFLSVANWRKLNLQRNEHRLLYGRKKKVIEIESSQLSPRRRIPCIDPNCKEDCSLQPCTFCFPFYPTVACLGPFCYFPLNLSVKVEKGRLSETRRHISKKSCSLQSRECGKRQGPHAVPRGYSQLAGCCSKVQLSAKKQANKNVLCCVVISCKNN